MAELSETINDATATAEPAPALPSTLSSEVASSFETSTSSVPGSDASAEPRTSMNVHIVSPSLPSTPIVLTNLPVSTTVGQLRGMISGAVQFNLPAADQRLIYLGRPLIQDQDTMIDVFGAERVGCYHMAQDVLSRQAPTNIC